MKRSWILILAVASSGIIGCGSNTSNTPKTFPNTASAKAPVKQEAAEAKAPETKPAEPAKTEVAATPATPETPAAPTTPAAPAKAAPTPGSIFVKAMATPMADAMDANQKTLMSLSGLSGALGGGSKPRPKPEEPKAEAAKTDEPKVDEPKAEEAKPETPAEEPAKEEAAQEEPAAEPEN